MGERLPPKPSRHGHCSPKKAATRPLHQRVRFERSLPRSRFAIGLWDTHIFSSAHPVAESALLSVSAVVLVLAVVPVVLVTALCMDLSANFACRELLRVDISVCGIGCQLGYHPGELAARNVLSGGPYT